MKGVVQQLKRRVIGHLESHDFAEVWFRDFFAKSIPVSRYKLSTITKQRKPHSSFPILT